MITNEIKSPLENLKKQLKKLNNELKEVHEAIRSENYSEYPVFVAHQENAKIGESLFDRKEYGFDYSINATTIERFKELKIITDERIPAFKEAYGNPSEKFCVFWINGAETHFIFLPFDKK